MLKESVLLLSVLLNLGCFAQTHFNRSHHLMNINKCKKMPAYNNHVHFHCEKKHHHNSEKQNKSTIVGTPQISNITDTANHISNTPKHQIIRNPIRDSVKLAPKIETEPNLKPVLKFLDRKIIDSLSMLNDEAKTTSLDNFKPALKFPPINFLHNQDEFSVTNMDAFMEAAEYAKQGHLVLVDGHTDDKGTDDYNQKLSLKRAQKIKQLMIDFGVKPELIAIKGSGEKRPLVPNDSDENRNKNRRIEFTVY